MNEKNILIIDDSALMRRVISDIIESDQRFRVIGAAINGVAGLSMLYENAGKVDAVLLDINMPRMNGLEFLDEIKKQNIKTTVIVVSAVTNKDAVETIEALDLGAFDFISKPESLEELRSNKFSNELLDCLAVATKLKWSESQKTIATDPPKLKATSPQKEFTLESQKEEATKPPKVIVTELNEQEPPLRKKRQVTSPKTKDKLVAIACSTGGPKALHTIIPSLPKDMDAGVVIVQHMPEGFTKSLADRLNAISQVPVKEAEDGEVLKKGWVYIAKGGKQLRVTKDKDGNHIIRLTIEEPRFGLLPCADMMYESLVDTDYDEITCVVLTGMGSDGSAGITELSKKKNIHVIAQDKKTSIVYGMPRMIKITGLVDKVLPLNEVSDAIIKNVGVH
ncbi:MAG: chemotaxis-specific protein-glutamate methyltransferase CheB [Anaerolineaceae bacterium]|nr:MAG: chemotaxis-specific protein-glutamate methyltransferase CheB [Anaerolineaceae bacterium]